MPHDDANRPTEKRESVRGTDLSKRRPSARLQRRAAVLARELEQLHWDNCKVIFRQKLAFTFALGGLLDGHEANDIASSYERALHECHAFATDRTAHLGQICRFEPSSTVSRARKFLKKDGLTPAQRFRRWREQSRGAANDGGSSEKIGPATGETSGRRLSQSCS